MLFSLGKLSKENLVHYLKLLEQLHGIFDQSEVAFRSWKLALLRDVSCLESKLGQGGTGASSYILHRPFQAWERLWIKQTHKQVAIQSNRDYYYML
jgi:hypothetical protein